MATARRRCCERCPAVARHRFRPDRVEATALALARKRARLVQRAFPSLVERLGDTFGQRFVACARSTPLAPDATPLADGRAFLAGLPRACLDDDDVRVEVALARLAVRRRRGGALVPRRGPAVVVVALRDSRRVLVAWRGGSNRVRQLVLPRPR